MNLVDRLEATSVIALDIETVDWWNKHQERIALIQLAYRINNQPKVAVIDAFAKIDLAALKSPLENNSIIKVIHNAVFDASRLANHYNFKVSPIFDTMVAARRSGEKRYSLQAQAEIHLKRYLDKSSQRSDWRRRPLDTKQIYYAANDAFSTLLLYENQIKRNLTGAFQLKDKVSSKQGALPLTESPPMSIISARESVPENKPALVSQSQETNITSAARALLGIVTELPSRYHPDGLAVSVGSDRVGMAGWIVDRLLGKDAEIDQETAKLAIAELFDKEFINLTPTQKLEATEKGAKTWQQLK